MANIAVLFGLLLTGLGVFGYLPEMKSITALIPSFVGVPLVVLGILAYGEALRKHAIHAAAGLSLIGFLAAVGRGGSKLAQGEDVNKAQACILIMAGLCAAFLAICMKSFMDARRRRASGA